MQEIESIWIALFTGASMFELHLLFDLHDFGTKICCKRASGSQVSISSLSERGSTASLSSCCCWLAKSIWHFSVISLNGCGIWECYLLDNRTCYARRFAQYSTMWSINSIFVCNQSTLARAAVPFTLHSKTEFWCSEQVSFVGHGGGGGSFAAGNHLLADALQLELGAVPTHRADGV